MNKKKILVVDDEPHIVETLKDRLEFAGYTIVTACDGEEGLKKAKEEKPDLILLDILMPKIDGYNFLRILKLDEDIKDIPVIMLTAKADMKGLFAPEGIVGYVTKPFDQKELLDKIEKIFEGESK